MTTPATLTAEPASDLRPNAMRDTVDCPHATSTAIVLPGSAPPAAHQIVQALVLKHFSEEGCRCTLALRRRYGLARRWP